MIMMLRRFAAVSILLSLALACSKGGAGIQEDAGTSGSGGTTGSGGITGSGGATGSGGTTASGGTTGSGGATGSGGTIGSGTGGASGGTTGTGGRAGGNAGMPGTGGNGGTGGSASSGTGGSPPVGDSQSVLERNKHPSRDGHFVQPTLTLANAARMAIDTGFNASYQGSIWNVPLYMANGPSNKGAFFVATIDNNVEAHDETTGALLWSTSAGPASRVVPCAGGPYSTIGIFSTPIIDAAARTIFVVNAVGPTQISDFLVHALSVDTGQERAGWPVSVKAVIPNFAPAKHNQRSALSLVNGILYVPFGGHWGDCNPYQGRVLAIDIKDPTKTGNWQTSGERAAIWAPGGMPSDGNGVFAVTGDSSRNPPALHQPEAATTDSNAIFRVTGMAIVDRSPANYYYPARWAAMDANDLDFGSNSPVYIQVPGSPHVGYVAAPAKDGHLAFLNSKNLGGKDGHIADILFATSGMSTLTATASYTTAKGVYVVLTTQGANRCPSGGGGVAVVAVSVPVVAGVIKPVVAWCAPLAGERTSVIATTTDGQANAIVWYISNGRLVGVDGDTGAVVAAPTATCAGVMRWTSPIATNGRIIAGGSGTLCSWSVH